MNTKEQKQWNKAQVYFNNTEFKKAYISLLKISVNTRNTFPDVAYLMAESLYQLGKYVEARNIVTLFLKYNPATTLMLAILGRVEFSLGNKTKAIELLTEAVTSDASDEFIYLYIPLCKALISLSFHADAIQYLEKLMAYEDYSEQAAEMLLTCYMRTENKDKAEKLAYRLLAKAKYNNINWMIDFYHVCENNGLHNILNDIYILVEPHLKSKPGAITTKLFQLFKEKKFGDVIDEYNNFQADDIFSKHIAAESYHKIKDYASAWGLYGQVASYRSKVVANIEPLNTQKFKAALNKLTTTESPLECISNPVFMLGFPRSGTTMLETVLDSSDKVVALSEEPTLNYLMNIIRDKFNLDPLGQLGDLSDCQLTELQSAYFLYVKKIVNSYDANNSILIDKNPNATPYLPLILKVFPNAKIIQPIRNPMDVVLSCYRQNFNINASTARLVKLSSIFETYKDTFELWQYYKSKLNFNYQEVKYEDVVTQFDTTIKSVCDFIGIEFTEDMKHFHNYAQNEKHVRSASKDQVTQPLYNSSVNSWHAYREYLVPFKKYIEPVAKHYGYDID